MEDEKDFQITPALAFDLNIALYLDLVALLEKAGVVTYRQMAARVLNISMDAEDDGEHDLSKALEGIAHGFASQENGLSIGLLKAARELRNEEALGDLPQPPLDS
jgi:hypothetical protein